MQKLNALTAAIAIFLTGCQSTHSSKTWHKVRSVPHVGPGIGNRSQAYADRLHTTLQRAGIEHKVVKFRFKYPGLLRLDRPGEDIAVIYRDPSQSSQPWWLASECIWSPVWLPTASVESQVAFYLRRPVTITSATSFPAAVRNTLPRPGDAERRPTRRADGSAVRHKGRL